MAQPQSRKRKRSTKAKDYPSKRSHVKATSEANSAISTNSESTEIKQDSPITNLPPELLSHILSYVLIKPNDDVKLSSAKSRRWRSELMSLTAGRQCDCNSSTFCRWPDLHNFPGPIAGRKIKKSGLLDALLVSRTFYFAGVEAFYKNNAFEFRNPLALSEFLERLGTDRRRHISRIRLTMRWVPIGVFYDWYGGRWELPAECQYTCDADEPALESDILAALPGLDHVSIMGKLDGPIRGQPGFEIRDAIQPIRQRIEEAWPSARGKLTIELA